MRYEVSMEDFYVTDHAKQRMISRSITMEDVLWALQYGRRFDAKEDRLFVVHKFLMLIIGMRYDKIGVCSVKYNRQFTDYAEQYAKDNGIGWHQALKQVREKGLENEAKNMPIVRWEGYQGDVELQMPV